MKLFAQLTKVDVEKRQVWGRATQEVADKAREIFDYESSVPLFRDWSAGFEKATEVLGEEGKSLGNIRAMHGKVAAGKVIAIDFNDAEKAIDIGTEITDDAEWSKVLKGTYTGFSIGGKYEKTWKDGNLTRFTARPSEISIVDNPCVPTATFSMIKADGAVETVAFQRLGVLKALISDDTLTIGDTIALMGEYLPADEVTKLSGNPDTTMGQVRDALRKFAADTPVAESKPAEVAPVKKVYTIRSLADVLQSIAWMAQDAEAEESWEKDASTIPEELRAWLTLGVEILKKMTAEETAELINSVTPPPVVVVEVLELSDSGDLEKKGARNSKGDLAKLQGIHDHSVAMGATCATEKSAAADSLAKAADLEKQLSDATTEVGMLKKRVEELEQAPAPAKGVLKVVEKAQDIGEPVKTDDTEKLDPDSRDFSLQVMKAAQRRGVVINPR